MSIAIKTEERTERSRRDKYFLPYEIRWLLDERRYKLWEKSRRIGATYTVAYGDVKGVIKTPKWPVWFSSADESAAKEYITYCETWAKVFDVVATNLGEVLLDSKHGVTALTLEFKDGGRIHALRSNPRGFRSKGGRVRLDEFAWHDDQQALWMAAQPCVMWGGDVQILSTHNGKQGLFYKFLDAAKAGENDFVVHRTDIFDAVREGLADKIAGRTLTESERQAFIDTLHKNAADEETWQQEYCCIPLDEATAFLTYELIGAIEDAEAGDPSKYAGGPCYVGGDIARRRDLFVLWVAERVGDVLWTREVVARKGISFAEQDAELDRVMRTYHVARVCMDQTGMGEKPVEDAKRHYGDYVVEGVQMTAETKQELANGLKRQAEDRSVRIPKDKDVRDDLHAVRKITTVAGNVRFDAERTDAGHADRFWAAALSAHAAGTGKPTPRLRSLATSPYEQHRTEVPA